MIIGHRPKIDSLIALLRHARLLLLLQQYCVPGQPECYVAGTEWSDIKQE